MLFVRVKNRETKAVENYLKYIGTMFFYKHLKFKFLNF